MMRVMTRSYIILVFISYLLFVDVSARFIPILPKAATSAAFSQTRLGKTLNTIPNNDWISGIKPSSTPIRPEQASSFKRYLDLIGFIHDQSDNVRSGLENFQRNYSVPVTGMLDDQTVELIKRPRCGVPDVINGASTSFSWSWPKGKKQFTYAFSPENNVDKPLKDAFSSAFSRWQKVTGLSFTETLSFDQSDIRIVFLKWDATEVVAVSDLLDPTTTSGWKGIYFDADEKWVVPVVDDGTMMENDELDIETAAMHQIGHMVGFGRTTIEEAAVMFPFMEQGKSKLEFATHESEMIRQACLSDCDTPSNGEAAGGVGPGWVGLGIALLLSFCF